MSKLNVLIYYDGVSLQSTGADNEEAETVASIKEKAAALRGRVGKRGVMLRDARVFDGVEPRVGVVGLLGGASTDALVSVHKAYEAVGVPVASYDELLAGDGPELTDDEDPESPASYLGRLKAAATERGLTFTDATTADDFEAMIKSFDDAKFQKAIDDMAEFETLTKEATELGVAYNDQTTNDQLRADIDAARELAKVSEGEEETFDVDAADFDALKAKADELEIAYPYNIGEATLRKKVADRLAENEE